MDEGDGLRVAQRPDLKARIVLAVAIGLSLNAAAYAQSSEELKQQLEAQKQINELLKQRIHKLEAELLATEGDSAKQASNTSPTEAQTAPETEPGDPEESRALERALVREGLSILPPGQWELTPGFAWVHSGSDAVHSRSDDYLATLDVRAGLPWRTMVGIGVPYFIKADREAGDNSGFGDLSLRLWKQFVAPDDTRPSVVGSIAYNALTGEDADGLVPLGSNFHRLLINLNASRSIDPLVLYGDLSYTHTFAETLNGINIKPGWSVGIRGGASLAITPDITGNLGLRVSFINELESDGIEVPGTEQTVGFLETGMGYILNKRYFLSITADIGITDDAPDLALGISLPVRF